ncbi:PLP-dependent cysteine synthase family protein [Streptomyces sp. NPDC090083]|uniref:PLP-dependent cysteine synthase family protein n=1 Tax=Streptomyces sp. NPDC090083 TaxID=3365941 RepID=UPI0038076480
MKVHEHLLDAVGGTPLIRLSRITEGVAVPIYGKAEFLNPSGSVKDRTALGMVLAAERSGALRPGGVIVEATSGNTGLGLVMVAAQRGYGAIIVVPDRSSKEKVTLMRALGAEVVITPSALPREHPNHVLRVAQRITERTPGAWYANQYDNPANPEIHRTTTGPEIWEQTEHRITHFVAGIGTGGTISGAGEFLKEVSGGRVSVVGADPFRSAYAGGDGGPFHVESIGRYIHPDAEADIWPRAYNTKIADWFERVSDRESILTTRRLASREGLLLGGSAGTAVTAALRVAATAPANSLIVVILPDTGRSYLSKYFDDTWLRRLGFGDLPPGSIGQLLQPEQPPALPYLTANQTVADALRTLRAVPDAHGPYPVVQPRTREAVAADASEAVGAVDPTGLRKRAQTSPRIADEPLARHMDPPLLAFGAGETVGDVLATLDAPPAVHIGGGTSESSPQPQPQPRDEIWILVDGAIVGVLTRTRLQATAHALGYAT